MRDRHEIDLDEGRRTLPQSDLERIEVPLNGAAIRAFRLMVSELEIDDDVIRV